MKILTDREIHTSPIPFKVDHTKKEYKYFTILERIGWTKETNGKKYPVYKALCKACNAEVAFPIIYLSKGSRAIKSCGCSRIRLTKEQRNDPTANNPAFKRLYTKYIRGAEERKLLFNLSISEFYKLTQGNCHYCGRKPYQIAKSTSREFLYNGVDRVDNKQGYLPDNVISCCGKCNTMKHHYSYSDFVGHIELMYKQLHAPDLDKFGKFGGKPAVVNPEPSTSLNGL